MTKLWEMKVYTDSGYATIYLDAEDLVEYVREVTESGGIVNNKGKFVAIHNYSVRRFQ